MKTYIKKLAVFFTILLAFTACQDDDNTFGDINSPSGLATTAQIVGKDDAHPNGDGTGLVRFTSTAKDAISYKYIFSDGSSTNSPSGILQKRFTKNGDNTYSVTVVATGKAGVKSSITFDIIVFSSFSDPVTVQKLTGGGTKKWYWAASEQGHLGVGPNNTDIDKNFVPGYYSAAPFEKAGSPNSSCLYDNVLTFSLDGDNLKMELNNGGRTFFNAAFRSVGGAAAGTDDLCLDFNTAGIKTVLLGPSDSFVAPINTTGTAMTITNDGFMGYYIGQSTYEILKLTDNRMVVRAVMGGNPTLAWYHTFTTSPPVPPGSDDFTNLVWSDEFETPGAPDPTKWGYNIGTGGAGWGNGEAQYYTDSPNNVIVADGKLKITAKKESFNGSDYTSARLVSENKFDFKYGKLEVRAKLPTGAGTWPAIWMLGKNYTTVNWPACGEIDMMEHVGNQQNVIHGSLHYPDHSGGNANTGTTTISTASTDFHNYSVIWTATSIKFSVDGTAYHTFANTPDTPFNANFFVILNMAMGGNFGGAIDPNFTQASMEVEYVRVYQ